MYELLKAAYAPGTWKNKINQKNEYVKFVRLHNMSALKPSKQQIMSYVAHLYNKFKIPGTVYNYLSGAKTWIQYEGGNTVVFEDYKVQLIKRGVAKAAHHKVYRAPPLSINDVKRIVRVFNNVGNNAHVFKAVTLIAYCSLLRQSNLVVGSLAGSASHVIREKDIRVVNSGLQVTVRSTKTTWRPSEEYTVCIPCILNSPYCPVQAWEEYYEKAPKGERLPAFWLKGGIPLTSAVWLGALRLSLKILNYKYPNNYTLHSLRRGGARHALLGGRRWLQ